MKKKVLLATVSKISEGGGIYFFFHKVMIYMLDILEWVFISWL